MTIIRHLHTSGADIIQECVVISGSYEGAREDNSVEGNIVLGHELVEFDLIWVLPPSLPLTGVASSDGEVARYMEGCHSNITLP